MSSPSESRPNAHDAQPFIRADLPHKAAAGRSIPTLGIAFNLRRLMLAHIPTWVFGLFALLLALGIFLSLPRAVNPTALTLAAVGVVSYSLYGVITSFGASALNILPWAAGLIGSVTLGKRIFGPRKMTRIAGSSKVFVPGSWLPLVLIMGIFLTKFLVGFVYGARLAVGTQAWFAPVVSAVLGSFSGGFTARALNIRRYAQQTASDA